MHSVYGRHLEFHHLYHIWLLICNAYHDMLCWANSTFSIKLYVTLLLFFYLIQNHKLSIPSPMPTRIEMLTTYLDIIFKLFSIVFNFWRNTFKLLYKIVWTMFKLVKKTNPILFFNHYCEFFLTWMVSCLPLVHNQSFNQAYSNDNQMAEDFLNK